MKTFTYTLGGLILAATAATAQAQPAADATGAIEGDVAGTVQGPEAPSTSLPPAPAAAAGAADAAVDGAAAGADGAIGAEATTSAPGADASASTSAAVSDTDIDNFAKATVKLQAIAADATIAEDQKQSVMASAVTEAGLDPATYNEIGAKVSTDPELRARVQTAMSRHAQSNDG